jgi:D-ribose pyranose/furanose isomerase RbsD
MKKLVPDSPPSFPIPYITIIADLSIEDAKPHAAALMDALSNTIQLCLATQDAEQRQTVLENIAIITELLRALSTHMANLEVAHG